MIFQKSNAITGTKNGGFCEKKVLEKKRPNSPKRPKWPKRPFFVTPLFGILMCTECDHQASICGIFNNHILIHNKDKPYSCPDCNWCFTQRRALEKHINSQHELQ